MGVHLGPRFVLWLPLEWQDGFDLFSGTVKC
jgi:hypothetical protein